MKIKIIKSVQFYFNEGDIIDTYTDERCNNLIKSGLAISLEPAPKVEQKEMIVGLEEKEEEVIIPKQTKKKSKK